MIFALVELMTSLFPIPWGSSEIALTVVHVLSLSSLFGQALALLGLVGLYVRQSQAVGILSLIAFLIIFFGTVYSLEVEDINWGASSAAYLGWALFGALSVRAGVYGRVASISLIVSGIPAALFNPLVINLLLGPAFRELVFVGLTAIIVVNAAVAWLGFSLFSKRQEEAEQPK